MNKKIKIALSFIISIFVILIGKNVYAASAGISASNTNIKVGQSTTIYVNVNKTEAWNLRLSSSGGSLSGTTSNADSAGSEVNKNVMTATFSASSVGTYTISLSGNITGSDLNKKPASGSVTINVSTSNSGSGSNGNSGTSTGNSSGVSTNSGNSSSTAELSNIKTSPVDFKGFRKANSGPYYVTVENSVTKIGVSATSTNGSTYTVSGNTDLQVGTNKVTVTAKKGNSTKQYYIYVTRKASNDEKITPNQIDKDEDEKEKEDKKLRLNNIILDDSLNIKLDPNFDPEIFEYTVILGEDYLELEKILINAIANIENAKVTINGNENLVDGENIVIITVEAKGYETVTYTIKVMKQKVEQTVAQPVLEVQEDRLDNSDKLLKKKIAICLLTSLIALIGIIFIAKQCYESTNDKEDYIKDDDEYIPSNQTHNNDDNNKKDIQEDNILQDIYTKNNFNDIQEEKLVKEEQLPKQERINKETDEKTKKETLDEFFNTKMNFYEEKPSKRHGKGKHS